MSKIYSIFPPTKKRQLLSSYLTDLIINHSKLKKSNLKRPDYKFYSILIEKLEKISITYGIDITNSLYEVSTFLINDENFEKKCSGIFYSSLLQSSIIVLITGFLAYFSHEAIEEKYTFIMHLDVLFIQFLGMFIIFSFYCLMRIKFFNYLSDLTNIIYQFKLMISCSIPISTILREINIQKILNLKCAYIEKVLREFERIITGVQNEGIQADRQLDLLIKEVWNIWTQRFEKFENYLNAFKIFVMPTFLLGGHFLSMLRLVDLL